MIEFNDNHAAAMAAKWLAEAQTTIRLAREMPALGHAMTRQLRAQSLQTCLASLKGAGDWFDAPDLSRLQGYIDGWLAEDENCRDEDQVADFCGELQGEIVAVNEALVAYEDNQDDWGMQRVRRAGL
jgi:hypothetical protein